MSQPPLTSQIGELFASVTSQVPRSSGLQASGLDLAKCERPSCNSQVRHALLKTVNIKGNRGSIKVCSRCYSYYKGKNTSMITSSRSQPRAVDLAPQLPSVNHLQIRKHVSAAQRGNQSNVLPVPNFAPSSHGIIMPPPASPAATSRKASSKQPPQGGMRIPSSFQSQPVVLPPLALSVPSALSHSEAIKNYREIRDLLRQRAQMAGHTEHSVLLSMRLVMRVKGKANPKLLLWQNVRDVPATISRVNLMNLIVNAFRGPWFEEYHGHRLELQHITSLLDKKKCELDNDSFPIRELCLDDKGQPKKGKGSEDVVVQIVIDSAVVSRAMFHKEMHPTPDPGDEDDEEPENPESETEEIIATLTRVQDTVESSSQQHATHRSDGISKSGTSQRPKPRPLVRGARKRQRSVEPIIIETPDLQRGSEGDHIASQALPKRQRVSTPPVVADAGSQGAARASTGSSASRRDGRVGALVPVDHVQRALSAQHEPKENDILSFLSVESVSIHFYDCPVKSYEGLVTGPQVSRSATNGFLQWMSGTQPMLGEMFYNTSHEVQYGSFKAMRRGRIRPTPFTVESPGGYVALKQARDRCSSTGSLSNGPGPSRTPTMPLKDRVGQLIQDALATIWAAALLQIVYDYIENYCKEHNASCPWEIPSFRYVRTGLAVTNIPNSSPQDKDVYLVEEFVDVNSEAEGPWRKYLNNNTARHRISQQDDPENFMRAEFLTFCQHLQYFQTGGQAFVTDFQGGNHLLSDPQIITDPVLGRDLFCRGNVSDTHRNFEQDHICNVYCKFFELPGYQ